MISRPAIHPLKILAGVGAAFLMWGLVLAYASSPAWANTITVTSLADDTDPTDGECTLREAITSANSDATPPGAVTGECAAGSGDDIINFALPGTAPWTVDLTGALPNLSSNIEIKGPGADQFTVRRPDTAVTNFSIFNVTLDSVVSISGITISGGNVPDSFGGGISNEGTLTVTDSTISGNSALFGGGIDNEEILTVSDSTISGNSTTSLGSGGGIYNAAAFRASPSMSIINSTISGNSASDRGGGVHNHNGRAVIKFSTITKNTAPAGAGSGVSSFGDAGTLTEVLSTIISANTNTDVDFTSDSLNSFVSKGYNLIGDGNATGDFNQTGDQTGVSDPKLGALADNGGPTMTHALLTGSPAIDKGNTDLAADQRGEPRPFDDPGIAPATGGDNSDIGSFERQLNQAPVANNDSYSANEDMTLSANGVGANPNGVLSNDTDADNDNLTATLLDDVAHGDLTLNSDGTFTYEPNKDFNGSDSFTYRANDGTADSATATVSITVNPLNDPPVAQEDAATTDEDKATDIAVLANDSDADGDALSVSAFTATAQGGTVTKNADGTLKYTPKANFNGTDSFSYTVSDGNGGTATATVTINVNPVNDAPTVQVASATSCGTDARSGTITLSVADVDNPASGLTLSGTSSNQALVPNANLVFAGTGASRTLTATAVLGKMGTATLTVRVSDGETTGTPLALTLKSGGNANDTLGGTTRTDILLGQNGDDTLSGVGGKDLLCGGRGNDTLNGGADNDTMTGALGADRFSGGGGTDTATDFSASQGDTRVGIP